MNIYHKFQRILSNHSAPGSVHAVQEQPVAAAPQANDASIQDYFHATFVPSVGQGSQHISNRSVQALPRVQDRSLASHSSFVIKNVKLPPLTIPHFQGIQKPGSLFSTYFQQ